MATNFDLLDEPGFLETSDRQIGGVVPSVEAWELLRVVVCNTTATDRAITLYLVPFGKPNSQYKIVGDKTIKANETRNLDVGPLPMPTGYSIWGKATASNAVTVNIAIQKDT